MKITMSDAWCYVTETNFVPQVIKNALQYEWVDEESGARVMKSLYIEAEQKFPAGAWYSVKRILERYNIFFNFEDRTIYPTGADEIENSIHLRDYQEAAERSYFDGENEHQAKFRGICSIATGGGKTIVASKFIAKINLPTVFFVHTKDLLVQTKRVMTDLFGAGLVGSAGGGEDDYRTLDGEYRQIVIVMIQALYYHGRKKGWLVKPEYADLIQRAKIMICDECHHSSSDSWFWVAQACPAPYRLGLTATPWRNDGRDLLLQAATGPVTHKISSKELVERGWLSKPIIKMYNVQVTLDPRFEDTTWHNTYKAGIVFNPHRNAIIAQAAVKRMAENKSVLIIINHKIHGLILWQMISAMIAAMKEHGKINANDETINAMVMNSEFDIDSRRAALFLFRTAKLKGLIGTSIYDEGVDLPSVNTVIMAAGGKSDTKIIQRLGRSLRLGDRCLFITANNNCTLLTNDPSKPFRCMELEKKIEQYNPKEAAKHAWKTINEVIGNVKQYDAEYSEIVGRRPIWEVNSKEIFHLWNEVQREGLLDSKAIHEVANGIGEKTREQYRRCSENLNNAVVGPEEVKLFRMLAMLVGVDETISVKCPYRKTKNEVEYIDFYDGCQKHLSEHSGKRLKTYDYEEHEPQEGFVDEFILDDEDPKNDLIYQTRGTFIDMDDMMRKYGAYFSVDTDDDIPTY